MTTTSTNLGLTLFNSTTDATSQSFLQYRTAVAGTGATSNFQKIDALFGVIKVDTVNGRVGIGTTSPQTIFDVQNTFSVSSANGNTIVGQILLDADDASLGINYKGYLDGVTRFRDTFIGNGKAGFIFYVDGSAGMVGIGNTSPATALDVTGTITTRGASAAIMIESRDGTGTSQTIYNPTGDDLRFYSTFDTVRISNSGLVGIGTMTNNSYLLQLGSDSAAKPGAGGLWTVASDERIKDDIELANLDRCYEIVKTVPLKRFRFKDDCYSDEQVKDKGVLGWIAQDVQSVFPKAVSEHTFTKYKPLEDGTPDVIEDCLDLNSGQMLAATYGALQKAMNVIEDLEKRISDLENS